MRIDSDELKRKIRSRFLLWYHNWASFLHREAYDRGFEDGATRTANVAKDGRYGPELADTASRAFKAGWRTRDAELISRNPPKDPP